MPKRKKKKISDQLRYNNDRAREIWGWGWELSADLKTKARKGEFSWDEMTAWDIKEAISAFNKQAEKAQKHAMDGNFLIALEYINTVDQIVKHITCSLTKKIRAEHGWNF